MGRVAALRNVTRSMRKRWGRVWFRFPVQRVVTWSSSSHPATPGSFSISASGTADAGARSLSSPSESGIHHQGGAGPHHAGERAAKGVHCPGNVRHRGRKRLATARPSPVQRQPLPPIVARDYVLQHIGLDPVDHAVERHRRRADLDGRRAAPPIRRSAPLTTIETGPARDSSGRHTAGPAESAGDAGLAPMRSAGPRLVTITVMPRSVCSNSSRANSCGRRMQPCEAG